MSCSSGLLPGHYRACDDIEDMIGAWNQRRLICQPGQRADQREEIVPIHIGARLPFFLGAFQYACARRLECHTGCMERGIFIHDGRDHCGNGAAVIMRHRDCFPEPCDEGAPGIVGLLQFVSPLRQRFETVAEQGFEKRFPCRKMAVERPVSHAGLARDIPQRCVGTPSAEQFAGDGEKVIVVLFCVGSHCNS